MNTKKTLLILTFFLVFTSGCIKRTMTTSLPLTYITPCNVLGENILIEAVGDTLSAGIVKSPLAHTFVDDVSNEKLNILSTYSLDCWWGKNIGEKSDLYYCSGAYTAPELSSENVIKRYIKKEFKVGFAVEKQQGSSWTVDGKTYNEPTKFYLTVKSVEASCTLASSVLT